MIISKLKTYMLAIGAAIASIGYLILNHKAKKAEQERDELEREYDEYKLSQLLKQEEQKRLVAEVEKESAISSTKKQKEVTEDVIDYKKQITETMKETENEKTFTFSS
jgi:uncharacterized membrane protein YhiD involved in acid resistance